MPPKRNVKSNSTRPKLPTNSKINETDNVELTEAELKFDQEVLWSISQFEKLMSTEKLSEAKSK